MCGWSGEHAEMLYMGEGSCFVQKEKISNNKHILCGCVVSCLFPWLFMFFLKELFVKDCKYVSSVHAGH